MGRGSWCRRSGCRGSPGQCFWLALDRLLERRRRAPSIADASASAADVHAVVTMPPATSPSSAPNPPPIVVKLMRSGGMMSIGMRPSSPDSPITTSSPVTRIPGTTRRDSGLEVGVAARGHDRVDLDARHVRRCVRAGERAVVEREHVALGHRGERGGEPLGAVVARVEVLGDRRDPRPAGQHVQRAREVRRDLLWRAAASSRTRRTTPRPPPSSGRRGRSGCRPDRAARSRNVSRPVASAWTDAR